jgi:Predicted peptidase
VTVLKRVVSIFLFILFLLFCYFYQKNFNGNERKDIISGPSPVLKHTNENIEPSDTFVEKKSTFTYNNQKMQYLLIFPAKYTKTTNRWPIILFLHGSSLRGEKLDLVKEYGPTWVAERNTDFPCVVLAPQCPGGEDWLNKADLLAALLDDILKKYHIDKDRVYLTGVSIGGKGTWYLACKHPEYFAAIAPIAAVNPIIPNTWNKQMVAMPIWAFHGEKDTVAPLKNDEAMIVALRNQGGAPRFTILSDKGHNIAGVYKNKELYKWFLTNTRANL